MHYLAKSLINISNTLLGGNKMYNTEKGSMEEILMILQNIGLQINEFEKTNSVVPVTAYKELLEFSITIARRTSDVSDTIDDIIETIENNL